MFSNLNWLKRNTISALILSAFILTILLLGLRAQEPGQEEKLPILIPLKDTPDFVKKASLSGQGRAEEVVFSPDGHYLALGFGNGIVLWDLTSGEAKFLSVPTKTSLFYAEFAFSPDSKTLASVLGREKIVIWDLATLKNRVIETANGIFSIAYSPDGRLLVTGSNSNGINIWEASTGKKIKNFLKAKDQYYTHVKFTPDGKYILANHDKTVVMVELATGKVVRTFSGPEDFINSLDISRDGKFLVTGSSDKSIIIFDVASGKVIKQIKPLPENINDVAISPNGRLIAAAAGPILFPWETIKAETTVLMIDLETNEIRSHNIPYCYAVALSPGGSMLATALSSGQEVAALWDISNYGIRNKFKKDPFETTEEYEARVKNIEVPYYLPVFLQANQYNADKGGFEIAIFTNKIFIRVERDKAKELVGRKPEELRLEGVLKYYNPENLKLDNARLVDTVSGQNFEVIKIGEIQPVNRSALQESDSSLPVLCPPDLQSDCRQILRGPFSPLR